MPATRLAYIRYRGPYYYGGAEFEQAEMKLTEWALQRGLWPENVEVIGVCPDNSAVTPPLFCQYDLGIAVEDGVDEDETVSIQTLPEITVAALDCNGTKEDWRWFLSEWLPRSGLRRSGHDYYEVLKLRTDDRGIRIVQCLLYVPVEVDYPNLPQCKPGRLIAGA